MNPQTVQASRSGKNTDFFQGKQLLNTKSLSMILLMNKLFLSVFIIFTSLLLRADNLLPNPNFEHKLAGYLLGDTGAIRIVPHSFNNTKWGNSLTFAAQPLERVALYLPEVPYKPDTEYEISFMAKSSFPVKLILSNYVRVNSYVGSVGKFYPLIGTAWKRYKFTYKTRKDEKWGGFRIIKNNNANNKTVDLSFADLYLGPIEKHKITVPEFSGSFQWDPLDRRLAHGKDIVMPVRVVCNIKKTGEQTIEWELYSTDQVQAIAKGQLKKIISPGVNNFNLDIHSSNIPNGIFRLKAKINGRAFINNTKFAVCPKVRVKTGELPVDIGLNSVFSQASKSLVSDNELSFIADCGVSFIRTWDGGNPFIWRDIEPQENKFDFSYADRLVEAANKAGVEMLVVLGGMCFTYPPGQSRHSHALPEWLYKKSEIVPCPPNMPQFTRIGRQTALPPMENWAHLVDTLTKRYKGKVRFYEIMNEPNLFFTEQQYLPYLQRAYSIIKKNDPSATAVGICATGDYNGHIISYVEGILKLGGGKYIDALSFHAYQSMFEDSPKSGEDVIKKFYTFLKINNLNDVRLWNTELYYLNPKARGGSDQVNGPRYHPGYLIRRYLLDAAQRIRASIAVPGIHLQEVCLINENFQGDSLSHFFNNRLLPNDKYLVSAVFAKLLKGTKFVGKTELDYKVRAYKFSGKDKAVATIFALYPEEKEKRKISLPSGAEVLDIRGNKMSTTKQVASPIPFYLIASNLNEINAILKEIKITNEN